eukprot:SM000001S04713  [mRNA]  locus=s1:1802815:1804233:+ [translate_table: standard]
MDERGAVEAEIAAASARLAAGPGLAGNLLDAEGFPRADVNIAAVRADRHRLAVLHTDHKAMTARIERYLQELHASAPRSAAAAAERATANPATRTTQQIAERPAEAATNSSVASSADSATAYRAPVRQQQAASGDGRAMVEDEQGKGSGIGQQPFAVIDDVTAGSPGQRDGLMLGDQMVAFGDIVAGPDCIPSVARELQRCEDQLVQIVVLRRGELTQLQVTPRRWAGRGLLG